MTGPSKAKLQQDPRRNLNSAPQACPLSLRWGRRSAPAAIGELGCSAAISPDRSSRQWIATDAASVSPASAQSQPIDPPSPMSVDT